MKKELTKIPLVAPDIFAQLLKAIVDTATRDRRQAEQILKESKKGK